MSAPRLLLAWLACAIPRLAIALLVGLDEDYGYFIHGRTNSAWYPLYEWLARGLWALTGGFMPLYFAVHLAVHSAIGPLVLALARALGLGWRTGWLAVAGVALMPYYASLSARQPQVGLTVSVVALLVLVFASWQADVASGRLALGFALISGLTVTLRPNAISTIAALYGLAWLRTRAVAHRRILASAGALLLVLSALALGNLLGEGRFTPFTSNAGFNLWVGNNPSVAAYAMRHDITSLQDALRKELPPSYASTPLTERDALLKRAALDYIAAHPWRSLWHALLKTWRYWDFRLEDARLTPLHWNLAYTVPYLVYGSLAVAGAVQLWRRGSRDVVVLVLVVLLSYWLPHAVFFGAVRMRMTTEFLLILLAAGALANLIENRYEVATVE